MKVAIIGTGFTGLSAGYFLAKKGIKTTLFEKEDVPGGLATGFIKDGWNWPLEKHYHHIFKSDREILDLANKVGVNINFFTSKTSILIPGGKIYPLDSALALLALPNLDLISKIRTGITLGYLKVNPFWKSLENITAKSFLVKSMGQKSWHLLWEPLFVGKFGEFANHIPASWFWARIKKRSASLGYPQGGFTALAQALAKKVKLLQGEIFYNTEFVSLEKVQDKFKLTYKTGTKLSSDIFDQVIATTSQINLPTGKSKLKFLGAVTLVLRLSQPFLPKNVYWLNIGIPNFPFLSIVEHTNLIPRNNYNYEHLVYVGNYLPTNHEYFSLSKEELLSRYDKNLSLVCPDYKKSLIGLDMFKTAFAQPVIPLKYSQIIPPLESDIAGLYLATLEQVYPFDRGINYAVDMGEKVARIIINHAQKN